MTKLAFEMPGWTPERDLWYRNFDRADLCPMRVTAVHRGVWHLAGPCPVETGRPPGRRAAHDLSPTVGDWVLVDPAQAARDGVAIITHQLPRTTAFHRNAAGQTTRRQAVAANVDTVFLVSGLDRDFNPRRIERYLTALWPTGARPVILLNKADQRPDAEQVAHALAGVTVGAPVHLISALQGDGLEALAPYLGRDQTVAVVGSSGVGKSTLVNALLGATQMATQAVRGDDQRGRHTTTHRQLLELPGGGQLIDTPGMRELALWAEDEAEEGVATAFPEIEALTDQCRFRDCRHQGEPGCAIEAARESGELDPGRLANWEKLNRELAFQARRQDAALARQEEDRWKAIQKANRARNRLRDRQRF